MYHKQLFLLIGFFAILIAFPSYSYARDKCVVWDQNDTGANVRATPNGAVINRLRNRRVVFAMHYRNDYQGRPWAYVSGYYQGVWRNWGWIYMDLLRCI